MGVAEYLSSTGQILQLTPHRLGGTTPNAGVNLVENERSLARTSIALARSRSRLHRRLQSQHDPGELTARGNLFQHLQGLAGIGGDQVSGGIVAGAAPAGRVFR